MPLSDTTYNLEMNDKMILLCLHLAEEVCSNYTIAVLQQVWKLITY